MDISTMQKSFVRWSNGVKKGLMWGAIGAGVIGLLFLLRFCAVSEQQSYQQEIAQGERLPSGQRVLTEPASGCKYVVLLDERGFEKAVVPHTSYNKHLDEPCPGTPGR